MVKPADVIRSLVRPKVPSVSTKLIAVLAGNAEHYLWAGPVPGSSGCFWIPTLYGSEQARQAILRLMKDRKMDHDEAVQAMDRFHTGLGDAATSLVLFAYVEIDHLSQAEQEARYEAFSAATGLKFCLKVFSGGKSVHAYIAFDVPLSANDPIREEIQRLLVVCLEGDTRIVNRGRLMRLPGWVGRDRRQPVLHLDAESSYDSVDLRDRLVAHATSIGINDVSVAYDTLVLAELLQQQVKHEVESVVADELLDQAELLRRTRGNPDPRELRVARAMLPRKSSKLSVGAVPHGAADGDVRVAAPRPERVGAAVWHDMPSPSPYIGIAPRTAVDAPCCVEKGGRKGTVYENGTVWCHRHGWGFRPGGARAPEPVHEVTEAEIDALVGGDDVVVDLDAERAERERERAEGVRRDADLAPLRERAARKRAEAEALDPEVVAGARAAMEFAEDVLADVRVVLGVGNENPTCGVHVLMHSAANGVVRTFRPGCGRLRCRTCGPMKVASKIAAVLKMPVVRDGKAVGEPLGKRPVWVCSVENRRLKTFHSRWSRECRNFSVEKTHQRNSDIHGEHAFAAFHLEAEVVVLSTFELPETGRSKAGRLVAAINDAEQIERFVLWLGLSAYRVDNDPIRVVVGKISSSHGLHLDPAGIARRAAASPWIAVALHAKPGAVSAAMQARDVAVEEKVEEDEVKAVKSVGSVSLETVVKVAKAAGGKVRIEHEKVEVGDVVIDEADVFDFFLAEAG